MTCEHQWLGIKGEDYHWTDEGVILIVQCEFCGIKGKEIWNYEDTYPIQENDLQH